MENPTIHSTFIPLELWHDILKALPTKSLSRFRCVSKTWNSLIRSPHFIAAHHAAAGNTTTHLFLQAELSFQPYFSEQNLFVDLKSLKTGLNPHPSKSTFPPSMAILAAANGLLLGTIRSENATHHFLCNPMIHKYVVLPEPEPEPSFFCWLGFGYDPQKNDFGVVKINYDVIPLTRTLNSPPTAKLCYARERVWKPVNGDLLSSYLPSQCPNKQCSTNGRVHWLVSLFHDIRCKPDHHLLVFSFESERFETLDLPQADDHRCGMQLLSFRQNLSVMYASREKYTLWSYSEARSWGKVMCFDGDPSGGVVYTSVYLGWREDGGRMMVVSDCDEWKLKVYDPDVGRCSEESYEIPMGRWEVHHVSGFDESLFLLDEETQALPLTQLILSP